MAMTWINASLSYFIYKIDFDPSKYYDGIHQIHRTQDEVAKTEWVSERVQNKIGSSYSANTSNLYIYWFFAFRFYSIPTEKKNTIHSHKSLKFTLTSFRLYILQNINDIFFSHNFYFNTIKNGPLFSMPLPLLLLLYAFSLIVAVFFCLILFYRIFHFTLLELATHITQISFRFCEKVHLPQCMAFFHIWRMRALAS